MRIFKQKINNNEEAEELMRKLEREEEKSALSDPDKPVR
jgi:hypothetical protein